MSVFVHPYTKKQKRNELFARCRCLCARRKLLTQRSTTLFHQLSCASFTLALCLEVVLTSSRDTWDWMRMHMLVVMHRRTLRENVYSAKIRCLFILQISIFYTWNRYIMSLETWSMYRSIHIDGTLRLYETGWWNYPPLQSLEKFQVTGHRILFFLAIHCTNFPKCFFLNEIIRISFIARYVYTYEEFVFVTEATAVQHNDNDRTKTQIKKRRTKKNK